MSTDWRDFAACGGEDPELWFAEGRGGQAAQESAAALRICGGCAVTEDCLRLADEIGATHGIFGGLDADQRSALRRHARA